MRRPISSCQRGGRPYNLTRSARPTPPDAVSGGVRLKLLHRLSVLLCLLLAGLLLGGVYLVGQMLDEQPLVAQPANASPAQVQAARAAAKRTLRVIQRAQPALIRISGTELQALPSLVVRAYPRLTIRLQATPAGVMLAASLRLPQNPLGHYLSISTQLPAGRPLTLTQVRVGSLRLPDRLVDWLLPVGLDLLLGSDQRRVLLDGVQIIESRPQLVTLRITPPANPQQHLSQLMERVRGFSGNEESLNQAWIGSYYQLLLDQAANLQSDSWVSLTHFIGPLFREVARRAPAGEEHLHSRAAIMALALYLGTPQFEQLTGPVLDDAMRRPEPHQRTLLRGRVDLRLHFVYSAALQVLGEEGLSYAIGEFKELLDANRGGSGFSFADLAADRAGTLFATRATADAAQARQFLDQFAPPLREPDLMIPIDQLPDGLTEQAFATAYQEIGGPRYQALVAQIDRQLLALRLYQASAD